MNTSAEVLPSNPALERSEGAAKGPSLESSGWIQSVTRYAVLFQPGRRDRLGVRVNLLWLPLEEVKGQLTSALLGKLHARCVDDAQEGRSAPLRHPARLTVTHARWKNPFSPESLALERSEGDAP